MWRGLPNGLAKCACSSCFPRRVLNPARVHLLLKESVPCSQNYLLQVTLSSTSDLVSRGGGLKEDRANQFQRSSDVQHHIQTTGSLLLLVVGTGGAGVVRGKQTRLWKARCSSRRGRAAMLAVALFFFQWSALLCHEGSTILCRFYSSAQSIVCKRAAVVTGFKN